MRDLKEYEIAILEGKTIAETADKKLNDEAFVLVNGIAGAVLEPGKRLIREAGVQTKDNERGKGGRGR